MADGLLSQPITARDAFGHGGLPMDLNPDDTPVGYDDAGMPVFRGRTGQTYYVKAQPQAPAQSQGILSMLAAVPAGMAQSIWDAVSAPANAARGKAVTLEDVWNTAGMAQAGAAPAVAPRGAARSGALRTMADDAITPAQRVAEMLRSGRADDVTDDLMAQVDPEEMSRLYEVGATGADMAMDQASRMARAREMYMDAATKAADEEFASHYGLRSDATWTGSPMPTRVWDDGMLTDDVLDGTSVTSLNELRGREDLAFRAHGLGPQGSNTPGGWEDYTKSMSGKGENPYVSLIYGDRGSAGVDPFETVIQSPQVMLTRNRITARFDPRLAHLANLSAGVGAMAYGIGQTDEERKRGIFDYLAKGGM